MKPRVHQRGRPRVVFNQRINRNMAATAVQGGAQPRPYPYPEDSAPSIPRLFTSKGPIHDGLETDTSLLQRETITEVLPFLMGDVEGEGVNDRNAHGVPHLDRERHVQFLHRQLGHLPAMFTAADPSRPWIFYWCLAGLTLLGEDVVIYRKRLVSTAASMQNATGGFAGGFGQTSHLATTYATILSLALVGGDEAFEVVDRRSMWRWLCSLKQPGGGFQMAIGGEEDVRYAFCPFPYTHPIPHGQSTQLTGPLHLRPEEPIAPLLLSRCFSSHSTCRPTRLHALQDTPICSVV